MSPWKTDVLTPRRCGGIMSIAVVEQLPDRMEHTFICEQCAGRSSFVFCCPSVVTLVARDVVELRSPYRKAFVEKMDARTAQLRSERLAREAACEPDGVAVLSRI